jgi:hypothetical protein
MLEFAEAGDVCCIIPGAKLPYIPPLANLERTACHLGVDCFLCGAMRGEMIENLKRKNSEEKWIKII